MQTTPEELKATIKWIQIDEQFLEQRQLELDQAAASNREKLQRVQQRLDAYCTLLLTEHNIEVTSEFGS